MLADKKLSPVLAALASRPELFSVPSKGLDKALIDAAMAQVADKNCTLDRMRTLADVIGRSAFEALLAAQTPATLTKLIKQYDKASAGRSADVGWARDHLIALATRMREPEPTLMPAKQKKAAAPKKPATPRGKTAKSDKLSPFNSKAFAKTS